MRPVVQPGHDHRRHAGGGPAHLVGLVVAVEGLERHRQGVAHLAPFETFHRDDQPDEVRRAAAGVAPVVVAGLHDGSHEVLLGAATRRLRRIPRAAGRAHPGVDGATWSDLVIGGPVLRLRNVTFMTTDPARLADFWAAALGLPQRNEGDDEVLLADADWGHPRYTFQRIDDVRDRPAPLHLDLVADDRQAEVARLVGLGATEVRSVDDDPSGVVWTVVRDPDGNEVCVTE